MKKRYYRAFIINSDELEIMIIDGFHKKDAKDKLMSFYLKSNKIRDYRKFYIFLIRVDYINGDYIDLE